jgi:hypothetical protein
MRPNLAATWSAACLAACSALAPAAPDEVAPAAASFVRLPLVAGWHDGHRVHYVTTEASDRATAEKLGATYAPRLSMALPEGTKTPGQRHALERIYKVTNHAQGNVLPSAPAPVGPLSSDASYSPLWRMFLVTWKVAAEVRELRSEEEILSAEEAGQVSVAATGIVVNCPVIRTAQGATLPGAVLIGVAGP